MLSVPKVPLRARVAFMSIQELNFRDDVRKWPPREIHTIVPLHERALPLVVHGGRAVLFGRTGDPDNQVESRYQFCG